MGSKPNIDTSLYRIDPIMINSKKSYPKNGKKPSLIQTGKEFDGFDPIDFNNFTHREEIFSMFPEYLITEAAQADMDLFLSMSRYDRHKQTFVVGCYENQPLNFQILAYKWKCDGDKKWKNRYGTHPNSTPLVRVYTDDRSIYFIEGHKDSLSAILLGLDFVMLPNAGYKHEKYPSLLEEVENRDIVFLVEDIAAYKCMFPLSQILAQTARSILLKQLSDQNSLKMDLSDYIQNFKTMKEVIHGLQN